MALYGKALSRQIDDRTTGNQARAMFGALADSMAKAYAVLAGYDETGVGQWTGIDAGSVAAARRYLDDTNTAVQGYYAAMPESEDVLTDDQLTKLRTSVSIASTAVKTIDDLFSTSFLSELSTNVVSSVGTVSAAIADGTSKLAGSFIGGFGIWSIVVFGLGALYFWHRWGYKLVT